MFKSPKFGLFVLLGIIFWFSFVVIIRVLGETVFSYNNPLMAVLYILSFPIVYVALLLSQAISRLPMREMFMPVVVMTVTAMFLDGFAIGFMPQLYGENPEHVMHAAAWILWGAAAGILVAEVVINRSEA